MGELKTRLQIARAAAGFSKAVEAARAFGWTESTYHGYENGDRQPSLDMTIAIAKALRVSLDWLLLGRGDMRGLEPPEPKYSVAVRGRIGAGNRVTFADDAEEVAKGARIELPAPDRIAAYVVDGDSQLPRFRHGEVILFDPTAVLPATLVGEIAVVETTDGRTLIKTLQRGAGDNRWTFESYSAPVERDVPLIGAYRVLGSLAGRDIANLNAPSPAHRADAGGDKRARGTAGNPANKAEPLEEFAAALFEAAGPEVLANAKPDQVRAIAREFARFLADYRASGPRPDSAEPSPRDEVEARTSRPARRRETTRK